MNPHVCDNCTRLAYPTPSLRNDAFIVGLSQERIDQAEAEGRARAERHTSRGRRDRFVPSDRVENDVQSIGAELAVSQGLRLPWWGGSEPDSADVGPYGVRWSRLPDCSPIRPSDDPERVTIFVIGTLPVYTLIGWLKAGEAHVRAWYRPEPPPYWCVPHRALHDLRRLPERASRLGIDLRPRVYADAPDDLD